MISVNLGKGVKAQLSDVSKLLNVSEDAFIKEAIENYLEDRQDYLDAVEVLHKNERRYSFEEVKDEFKDDLQN